MRSDKDNDCDGRIDEQNPGEASPVEPTARPPDRAPHAVLRCLTAYRTIRPFLRRVTETMTIAMADSMRLMDS